MNITLEIKSYDGYKYDFFELVPEKIIKLNGNERTSKSKKPKRWKLDCVFVHYLVKELTISTFYRQSFIRNLHTIKTVPEIMVLCPTTVDLIDYNWNNRMYHQIRERCELDHALSWLSTLGGAFSALGDYFERCAETAGKISIHQLKLALKLGDPNIATRCRLYLSISLIQKKKFKSAKRIIQNEFYTLKTQPLVDTRLVKMCHGIWAKLKYEWAVYRKCINIKKEIKR